MNKKKFMDLKHSDMLRICRSHKINLTRHPEYDCTSCPLSIKTLPEDNINIDGFCYLRVWENMYINLPKEEYKLASILRRCANNEIEISNQIKKKGGII